MRGSAGLGTWVPEMMDWFGAEGVSEGVGVGEGVVRAGLMSSVSSGAGLSEGDWVSEGSGMEASFGDMASVLELLSETV